MSIPQLKITMLGASGSGKTVFLHGMYAILSAGYAGYFLYTVDPDQDIDLMDSWDLLCDKGRTPPPTPDEPVRYEFILNDGLTPLVEIDCEDYRGAAALARRDEGADVETLYDRLVESDSIYLVLDGADLGRWVRQLPTDGGGQSLLNRARDPMKIGRLTRHIDTAAKARIQRGLGAPSIVVLITKSDLIAVASGMSRGTALQRTAQHLEDLAQITTSEGVTTVVCPVTVGDFGESTANGHIDPTKVNPVNIHKPLIFSLWHYLVESRDVGAVALRDGRDRLSMAASQLLEYRSKFMGGLFHGSKITAAEQLYQQEQAHITEVERRMSQDERRAKALMDTIADLPLIKDGKWQL